MKNQTTNTAPRSLRDLIADDSFGLAFQTMAQYRAALLKHEATRPAASPGLPPCPHCGQVWHAASCEVISSTLPRKPAEVFAWAVVAENDNVIIWSKNRGQVESASKKYGRPIVPVIALSAAQQAAASGALDDTKRLNMIETVIHEQGYFYLHSNKPLRDHLGLNVGGGGAMREDLDDLMRRRGSATSAPGTPEAPKELPPLPTPTARLYSQNGYRRASVSAGKGEPLFAADQMRDYARAAQLNGGQGEGN